MGKEQGSAPPKERWSKNKIAKETGIPYTTVCKRLSGRHGGVKRGNIAGEKHTAKVLKAGKVKWVIFQKTSLKDIVMVYARRGFLFTQLCMLVYEIATREGPKGFSLVKQKAGRYRLKGFYQLSCARRLL